jgi:hypothetical protein
MTTLQWHAYGRTKVGTGTRLEENGLACRDVRD